MLPSLGLGKLFNNNQYVTSGDPAVDPHGRFWSGSCWTRRSFGYELKATGFNKNAAKYCGMAEKRNVILTPGDLRRAGRSGRGACCTSPATSSGSAATSSVPAMGFNGIAAAFLGGLNPLGTMLASFFIQHITAGGAYVDKIHVLRADLRPDLRHHHLSVRLRAVHEVRHEPLHRQAARRRRL